MKNQLSILIPARDSAHCIALTVERLERYLQSKWPDLRYEILVLPNKKKSDRLDETERLARMLESPSTNVKVIPQRSEPGKGAAIQTGILLGQGPWFLFVDADLPFDLSCLKQVMAELEAGTDYVTANRRLPASSFRCRVPLLYLVNRRHRLGVHFNRVVRHLLGIRSTDTQAGMKAFSERFARVAAAKQTCPNFFFDLEHFTIAQQHGFSHREFPVEFRLESEKSTITLFRELFTAMYWIFRIVRQKRQGQYAPSLPVAKPPLVTADDWGLSPAVNDGILHLIELGIVRRVSVMANGKYLGHRLDELVRSHAQTGLHFDLTYGGADAKFTSKGRLLAFLFNPFVSRGRKNEVLSAELRRQLGTLERAGLRIQHLDGHHHVHVLPFVSNSLSGPLKEYGIRQVRLPLDKRQWLSRRLPLNVLSLFARRTFKKHGYTSYPFVYPSHKDFKSDAALANKISRLGEIEVIVHPANRDDLAKCGIDDPYRMGRVVEYEKLRALFRLVSGPA